MSDISIEQMVASLSQAQQEELFDGLDIETLMYDWRFVGRPSQLLPLLPEEGGNSWSKALLLGGRGAGKTRSGMEWIREIDTNWRKLGRVPNGQRLRLALLGRTASDVRDTLIQGQSGLMNIYPPSQRDQLHYTPSRRRVDLPCGGIVICFSADKPDQLRGPEFHAGVADEIAAHKQVPGENELTALENLEFAVRLGNAPQILLMTTPRKVAVLKRLLKEASGNPKFILRRARTKDNVHLDQNWYQNLVNMYEGTEKGRQELEGELLDAVSGAIASEDKLNETRLEALPLGSYFRFVGLDPSVSEKGHRDEAGIVVTYVSKVNPISARHAYVIDDLSDSLSPDEWAERAIVAATQHRATIIVETNQGGALIKNTLSQVARELGVEMPPIKEVWSSKSKAIRAQPVAVAIQRGRFHLIGEHELLEDELTSWVPEESYSPNRLDALVFGMSGAMFEDTVKGSGSAGSVVTHSMAGRSLATSGRRTRGAVVIDLSRYSSSTRRRIG